MGTEVLQQAMERLAEKVTCRQGEIYVDRVRDVDRVRHVDMARCIDMVRGVDWVRCIDRGSMHTGWDMHTE